MGLFHAISVWLCLAVVDVTICCRPSWAAFFMLPGAERASAYIFLSEPSGGASI